MKLIHLATATAAVALLGGAAFAQEPAAQPVPASEATTPDPVAPADSATPPIDTAAPTTATTSTDVTASTDTAPAATTAGSDVSFTSMTVTNGPVPDTKENRAKYGQPMSRAGKMTSARGN